jgi:hypothetical protein
VVFIVYTLAVIATVATGSDTDAGVSTLLLPAVPGAMGAAVVTLADIMVRRDERRSSTHLISGA